MRKHLYTIALVCLMVLAAWWAGLMPAQAQVVGGGGGVGLPAASGTGQCLNSVSGGSSASQWGSCGSGNLPALGSAGQALVVNSAGSAPTWATCGGDVTCSALTPGSYTVTGINGAAVPNLAALLGSNGSSQLTAVTVVPAANGGAGTISGILKANGSGTVSQAVSSTDYAPATSGSAILKGNGSGGFSSAVSGTDYAPATAGNSILKGNSAGAFANAVAGTDYAPATSGSSILKGNGAGGFSNATSGTDYAPATSGSSVLVGNGAGGFSNLSGNTLSAHNFATSVSAGGVISGAQPAFTDISGTAQVAQGGTGHTSASAAAANAIGAAAEGANSDITSLSGLTTPLSVAQGGMACPQTATLLFSQLPGSPAIGTTCSITDATAGACVSGATISSGTGTTNLTTGVCQLTYLGSTLGWVSGGASAASSGSGTVNTGVLGNSPLYAGTVTIGPVTNEIHANTSTLAAALAAITQTTWTATHGYIAGQLLYDGTNTERIADWQPSTSYTSNSILVPFTGNGGGYRFTQSAASCTSGTTKPTWPQTSGNTVNDGSTPCVWHNTGAVGCTSGSSTPSWSGSLGGVVNDGTCPWMNYIKGAAAPSVQSNIVLDPGKTYTVSTATLIGGTNLGQTLNINGASVQCTDTGGAGHGCLVEGNWGKIIGANRNTSSINTNGSANIDALVESNTAYAYSALGLQYQSTNMDVEHVGIIPGGSTINQAAFWISGIDGLGNFQDIFVGGSTATSIPAGILVDDAPNGSAFTGMFWNALNFRAVWIGVGTDVHGLNILCGATSGSSGANLLWSGGAITDGAPTATVDEMNINGGSNGSCMAITQHNTYYESKTVSGSPQTGNFIDLSGAGNVTIEEDDFNGGPTLTDCISIANASASGIRATGRANACTNVIANAVTGQTLTLAQSGALHKFSYNWDNPSFSNGPIFQIGGLVNPWGPGGPAGTYYSAAGTALPACSSSYARYMECVSDSTACTSGTTYTSGGSTACMVQCNTAGSAWKETGISCF